MEQRKEALYTAFGELLYAVSMVDGEVQLEEAKKIATLIKDFPGAKDIEWSFEYEFDHKKTVEEAYQSALNVCKWYGPSEDYDFLFKILQEVSQANPTMNAKEKALINRFRTDLQEYFSTLQ